MYKHSNYGFIILIRYLFLRTKQWLHITFYLDPFSLNIEQSIVLFFVSFVLVCVCFIFLLFLLLFIVIISSFKKAKPKHFKITHILNFFTCILFSLNFWGTSSVNWKLCLEFYKIHVNLWQEYFTSYIVALYASDWEATKIRLTSILLFDHLV